MQQGKTITFASLFSEVSNVEIPIIQWDYAQGRKEAWEIRDQFLHSLSQALTAPVGALPLDLDFIYGNLSTEERPTLSVLDGQQRLTTLFLLHWYLANKEAKYADFSERFTYQGKSRFTYQTRTAAMEFFHALVRADNSGLNFAENAPALREQITDSHWFYHSWLQDPTVSACLTMLNAIQSYFGHVPGECYAKLCSSDSQPVVFQYLNLPSFGLSDDLYIKMNSRGKSLTDFENFKAWLSGRMSQQPGAVTFGERIDQAWTDMFWNLSKKRTESFDTLFLRFFKRMAFLLECSQSSEPAYLLANLNAAWFNTLRSTREGFSSSEFEARDTFTPRNIQLLSSILDFLCSPHATRDQWHKNLEEGDLPAISEANILSTFKQLHLNKRDVFERGIINVFKGLSWDYKTNSPCCFGKKLIINNLVTHNRWGFSLNWGWRRDQLADLERMLYLLDGKPIPDNRADISTRLMEHIRDNPAKEAYEDEFFSIRYFQKGTVHLTFNRLELIEKMNDIIARHYPGMLASR